jgi:hypothetical protein
MRRALDTVALAKKQLPLTYKVGQMFPDAFNEGCREHFGRQGGINWTFGSAFDTGATKTMGGCTQEFSSNLLITSCPEETHISVTDTLTGAKMNLELPTEAQIQLKEVIEDNVMDVALEPSFVTPISNDTTQEGSADWGNGWGGGWGESEPGRWDQNTWITEPVSGGGEEQGSQEASGEAPNDANPWTDSNPTWNRVSSSLISLLGPSVFPLTHTTGIVECSTRRISAVYPPLSSPGSSADTPSLSGQTNSRIAARATDDSEEFEWAASASGVEAELDKRLAKVVLEPWGREEGDISGPEIWSTSRGPVVDPKSSDGVTASATDTSTGLKMRKPHNPLTDNITLLVEPSLVETLSLVPGLGLGAMWIEIARQEAEAEVSGDLSGEDDPVKYPKGFWYHEDVTGIFPSFYTARAK